MAGNGGVLMRFGADPYNCGCSTAVLARPSTRSDVRGSSARSPRSSVMVMANGGGGGLVQSPPDMLHHHNIMDTSSHVEMMPSEYLPS
ncbi:unnamed protein product, partial [Iphiclides podalirius]